MATGRRSETTVEERLQEALDAAEGRELRYHIRESMQFLHLEDED